MRFLQALASVVLSMAVLGCGSAAEAPKGRPPPASDADPARAPSADLATLLSYEVEAEPDRSTLLREYAEKTGLEVRAEGSVVRAGPFLSHYEAHFLAGLVPGARASLRDKYEEPATPDPWKRLPQKEPREASYVGTRRLLGERFALVTFDRPDETKEIELYQTAAAGPRFVSKLPKPRAAVETSSGIAVTRVGQEVTFLQIMNEKLDGAAKAERLVAWRWAVEGREVLFDYPFLRFTSPDEGDPAVTVMRVAPHASGVSLVTYKVTFKRRPAAQGVTLALNDWGADAWKEKKPLPDLVEIASVEKIVEKTTSLE